MAQLAVRLQIFVASSSDAGEARDTVEAVIKNEGVEISSDRLLLKPFLWERYHPLYAEDVQAEFTRHLNESELAVILFKENIGPGLRAELEQVQKLVRDRRLDTAFMYFQASGNADSEAARFEAQLGSSRRAVWGTFETLSDLQQRFQRDLRSWLGTWRRIPRICEYALQRSAPHHDGPTAESRFHALRQHADVTADPRIRELGRLALSLYVESGGSAGRGSRVATDALAARGLGLNDIQHLTIRSRTGGAAADLWMSAAATESPASPFIYNKDGGLVFSSAEWFWHFCGFGLFRSILADDFEPMKRLPYRNDVHQHLKAFVATAPEGERARVAENLAGWLAGRDQRTAGEPIVRNFAAYVLGMIDARAWESTLAEAVATDEGAEVRLYSITSLGKLRSRRYLRLLVDLYDSLKDKERLFASQAIARIVGIARYEL